MTDDPLGDTPTEDLSKKKLDKVLAEGDPEAAGMIHCAIEDFAKATTRTSSCTTTRWCRA